MAPTIDRRFQRSCVAFYSQHEHLHDLWSLLVVGLRGHLPLCFLLLRTGRKALDEIGRSMASWHREVRDRTDAINREPCLGDRYPTQRERPSPLFKRRQREQAVKLVGPRFIEGSNFS